MKKNVASQKWRVFSFNRTTAAPVTGDAANITAKVAIDHGTATAVGDTNPTEVEDGYYLFDLTQAETNGDVLDLYPESTSSNVQVVGLPGTIYTTHDSSTYQQAAREAHGVSGTVWHVTYNASETMGNDGLSWATADLTAGAGVKTVIEAATAGDLVLLGAGTFALGSSTITIPPGVVVCGAGRDVTNLTSSAAPFIFLSSNSHLQSVSFTVATLCPIGGINGTVAGATVRDCRLFGTQDSAAFEYAIGVQFFDCEFEGLWDGVVASNASQAMTIDLFNCHIYLTAGSGHTQRGIYLVSVNSVVNMFGGTISVTGSAGWSAEGVTVSTGTVRLLGVKIRTSGGDTNRPLRQLGAGVLIAIGCDYDRTTSSGTIIDIPAHSVNADGLALALDTTVAKAATALTNATWTDTKAGYLTGAVALEATLTAIKGAGWSSETLAAIDVLVDAIKVKTDGLTFTGSDVKATLDGEEVTPTTASKTGYALSATGLDAIPITASTGLATTFREAVIQTWRRFFGKAIKNTSTNTIKTYNEAGAVATTQTISETATTETQGESV